MGYQWLIKGFGYDAALEFIFAFIALVVAAQSYRMYMLSKERTVKLLAYGFTSLAVANIVLGITNLMLRSGSISYADPVLTYGVLIHFFLYLIGLACIAYLTLGFCGPKYYIPLIIISALISITTLQSPLYFYIIIILLFGYILGFYYLRYRNTGQTAMFPVLIGIFLIAIGNVNLIVAFYMDQQYLVSHLIRLIGYVLIMSELIRIWHTKK